MQTIFRTIVKTEKELECLEPYRGSAAFVVDLANLLESSSQYRQGGSYHENLCGGRRGLRAEEAFVEIVGLACTRLAGKSSPPLQITRIPLP